MLRMYSILRFRADVGCTYYPWLSFSIFHLLLTLTSLVFHRCLSVLSFVCASALTSSLYIGLSYFCYFIHCLAHNPFIYCPIIRYSSYNSITFLFTLFSLLFYSGIVLVVFWYFFLFFCWICSWTWCCSWRCFSFLFFLMFFNSFFSHLFLFISGRDLAFLICFSILILFSTLSSFL